MKKNRFIAGFIFTVIVVIGIALLPLPYRGMALELLLAILACICVCHLFYVLRHPSLGIVVSAGLMMVLHEWEQNEIRAYAEEVANTVVSGGDLAGLLDHPPWLVKMYCYGRMDWLRNEVLSNDREYALFNSAVCENDEASINECLAEICDRFDKVKCSEKSIDASSRIAYKTVEAIQINALGRVSRASLGVSNRADMLFKAYSGAESQGAQNVSVNITAFSNSVEYVNALFARNEEKYLALMRDEWSFAVGVPEGYPDTFPVMISSNFDLSRLKWERLRGTNFCGYIEAKCVPRCGNGLIVVVCKSGRLRMVENAAILMTDSNKDRLAYRFDLRKIFGEVPQGQDEGLYYLTPAGRMPSGHVR